MCQNSAVTAPPPVNLPDPLLISRIEDMFWNDGGALPPEASVAVRGAPISADKFFSHAARQAREYSLRGQNMASVSADVILPDWPLERILANQLGTYSRFGICPTAGLVSAGFELLATGQRPHVDIVLPGLGIVEAARLSEMFAPSEERNPYKRRR